MDEDLPSHVPHDVLARHFRHQGLAGLGDVLDDDAGEEGEDDPVQPRQISLYDVVVHTDLGQPRPDLARHSRHQDERESEGDPSLVGPQIGDQPDRQPELKRALLNLLLLVNRASAHSASSSAASLCRSSISA